MIIHDYTKDILCLYYALYDCITHCVLSWLFDIIWILIDIKWSSPLRHHPNWERWLCAERMRLCPDTLDILEFCNARGMQGGPIFHSFMNYESLWINEKFHGFAGTVGEPNFNHLFCAIIFFMILSLAS